MIRLSLTELRRRNVPRADLSDAFLEMTTKATTDQDDEVVAVREYLGRFAKPCRTGDSELISSVPCLCCGKPQCGMLGHFRWGLIHGHGSCVACGWPAIVHHQIDPPGVRLDNVLLQVHPDYVEKSEKLAVDLVDGLEG